MIENHLHWLVVVIALCLFPLSGSIDQDFTNPASSNINFENFGLAELAKQIAEASVLEEKLNETDSLSSLGNILLNLTSDSNTTEKNESNESKTNPESDLGVTVSTDNTLNDKKVKNENIKDNEETLKEANQKLVSDNQEIAKPISLDESSEHPEAYKVLEKRETDNVERPRDINATVQTSEAAISEVQSENIQQPINDPAIYQGQTGITEPKPTAQDLDGSRKFRDVDENAGNTHTADEKLQPEPGSLFMKNPPMLVANSKARCSSCDDRMQKVVPDSNSFIELGGEHDEDDTIRKFQGMILLIDSIIETAGSGARKELGLCRKSKLSDAACLLTNEEDKMEKAVLQIVSCVKDAMKDQLSSKCCIPLPRELHSFLIWLMHGSEGGGMCPPTVFESKSKPSYLFHEDNHRPHIASTFLGTPPSPSGAFMELLTASNGLPPPHLGKAIPAALQQDHPEPIAPQYAAESNPNNNMNSQLLGEQPKNDQSYQRKMSFAGRNYYRPLRSLPEENLVNNLNENQISDQSKEEKTNSREELIANSEENKPLEVSVSENNDPLQNQIDFNTSLQLSDNNLSEQSKSITKRDLSSRKHLLNRNQDDYFDNKSNQRKKKRRDGVTKFKQRFGSRDFQPDASSSRESSADLRDSIILQSGDLEDERDFYFKDRKEKRKEKKKKKCVNRKDLEITDDTFNVNLGVNCNKEKRTQTSDEYRQWKSFDSPDDSARYEDLESDVDHDSDNRAELNNQENKPKKKKHKTNKDKQMKRTSTEKSMRIGSNMSLNELSPCMAMATNQHNKKNSFLNKDLLPSGRTFQVSLSCRKSKTNKLKPSIVFEDDLVSDSKENERDIYMEPEYGFNDVSYGQNYVEDDNDPMDLYYESSKTSTSNIKSDGVNNKIVRKNNSPKNKKVRGQPKKNRPVKKKKKLPNKQKQADKNNGGKINDDNSQSAPVTMPAEVTTSATTNSKHSVENKGVTSSDAKLIPITTDTPENTKIQGLESLDEKIVQKEPVGKSNSESKEIVEAINKDAEKSKNIQSVEHDVDDKSDKLQKEYDTFFEDKSDKADNKSNDKQEKMSEEKLNLKYDIHQEETLNNQASEKQKAYDKVGEEQLEDVAKEKPNSTNTAPEDDENKYNKVAVDKQEEKDNTITEDKESKNLDAKKEDKDDTFVEDKQSKNMDTKIEDKYETFEEDSKSKNLDTKKEDKYDSFEEDKLRKNLDTKKEDKFDTFVEDKHGKNLDTKKEDKYDSFYVDKQSKNLDTKKEDKYETVIEEKQSKNLEIKKEDKYDTFIEDKPSKNVDTKKEDKYDTFIEDKQSKIVDTKKEDKYDAFNEDKQSKNLDTKKEDKYDAFTEDKKSKNLDSKQEDKHDALMDEKQGRKLNTKLGDKYSTIVDDKQSKKFDAKIADKYETILEDKQGRKIDIKIHFSQDDEEKRENEQSTKSDKEEKQSVKYDQEENQSIKYDKEEKPLKNYEKEDRNNESEEKENRKFDKEEKLNKNYSYSSEEKEVKNVEATTKARDIDSINAKLKEQHQVIDNEKIEPKPLKKLEEKMISQSTASPDLRKFDNNITSEEEELKKEMVSIRNESDSKPYRKPEYSTIDKSKLPIVAEEKLKNKSETTSEANYNREYNTDANNQETTTDGAVEDDQESISRNMGKDRYTKLDPKNFFAVSFDNLRERDKSFIKGKCRSKDNPKNNVNNRKNVLQKKTEFKKKAKKVVASRGKGLKFEKSALEHANNLRSKSVMNKNKKSKKAFNQDVIISKASKKKKKNEADEENDENEIEDIKAKEELDEEVDEELDKRGRYVGNKPNDLMWIDDDKMLIDPEGLSNIDGTSNSDILVDNIILSKPVRADKRIPLSRESILRLMLPSALQYSKRDQHQDNEDALLNLSNILKGISMIGENIESSTVRLMSSPKISADTKKERKDKLSDEGGEIRNTESTMVKLSTLSTVAPRAQEVTEVNRESSSSSKPLSTPNLRISTMEAGSNAHPTALANQPTTASSYEFDSDLLGFPLNRLSFKNPLHMLF